MANNSNFVNITLKEDSICVDNEIFEVHSGQTITWKADGNAVYGIVFKNESPLQHRAYVIPRGGTLTQIIAVAVAAPKDFEYTIVAKATAKDKKKLDIQPLDPIGRVIP
jgi:hypothetical protein